MYKGKAVENARVNFVPTEGYPVAAVTDASGLYSLSGVRYGASKVTVDLLSEPLGAGKEPQGRNPKATPEEKEKARASQAARTKEEKDKPPAAKLPTKYRELGTTPLVHNVIGPDGTFDIELKD